MFLVRYSLKLLDLSPELLQALMLVCRRNTTGCVASVRGYSYELIRDSGCSWVHVSPGSSRQSRTFDRYRQRQDHV